MADRPLSGAFIDRSPDNIMITSVESVAQRLDLERLTAPRVLTSDEVNMRGRVLSAILSEPRMMSRKSKDRITGIFNDMVLHSAALRHAVAVVEATPAKAAPPKSEEGVSDV